MALERTILTAGVVLFTLALAAMAPAAHAQDSSHCAPRAMVIERLAVTYGETRRAMGLAANNTVIETFASDDSGSWTITATFANGLTCLIASGQDYEALADHAPPQGKGA